MSERHFLFDRLADMWQARDPMPEGLIDKVLVSIETENLDLEYELLQLVERSRVLDGARGTESDAFTIVFSRGSFSLMLRVSDQHSDVRRVDGWITPAHAMKVSVTQHNHTVEARADGLGRFEIPRLPTGLTRFWLIPEGAHDATDHSFATPTFEL